MRSALLETASTMPSLAQFSAVRNGLAQLHPGLSCSKPQVFGTIASEEGVVMAPRGLTG
jgi:hypothetical protein